MNLEEIKELCKPLANKNITRLSKHFPKKYPEIYETLIDLYGDIVGKNKSGKPDLAEMLYLGANGIEMKTCKRGNTLPFNTIEDGFRFCKKWCECDREHQSKTISDNYKLLTNKEKQSRQEKKKKTLLEKYGVDNYMKTKEGQEKAKTTNLEKYGVEKYSQTKEYKEKIKKTSLEKFGVEHFTQNEKVKAKTKETHEKNFGGMMVSARKKFSEDNNGLNPFQIEEIKERIRETNLEKYGVEQYSKTSEYHNKAEQTNLERYGVSNVMFLQETKEKIRRTNIEKYERNSPTQIHLPDHTLSLYTNLIEYKEKLHELGVQQFAKYMNTTIYTIHRFCRENNIPLPPITRSRQEEEIGEYLTKLNIVFEMNNRKIIHPLELDFYIPAHNLAVEFCGLYWHSQSLKPDKNYHYNKWKLCQDQGINLLTIFEDEYTQNPTFWLNKIAYMCKVMKTKHIPARKCKIVTVNNSIKKNFCNLYHIQKDATSSINYGLEYENELVAVMTFSIRMYMNKTKKEIELVRFCSKNNITVQGGAGKLLSHFLKTNSGFDSVISFSDNRYSDGNVYKALGFRLMKDIPTDYMYLLNYTSKHHKFGFRKDKIAKKFGVDVSEKTENQLMQELGFDRIWDCGKKKWILTT